MGNAPQHEPLIARLHFLPRAGRGLHAAIISTFGTRLERSRNWVLLTTKGRVTGRPHTVMLPCTRTASEMIVISTYAWRSDWIRNLRRTPEVTVTWDGEPVDGVAEVIEDVDRKRALITAHPLFPAAPSLSSMLGPLITPWLRRWVGPRPVVVVRVAG